MAVKFEIRWIATAFVSLLIYAIAVWSTHQYLTSHYSVEQFMVASALSHAVHGSPTGGIYFSIVWPLYEATGIHELIATLKDGTLPRGELGALWTTVPDGLGIVMVATVTLLFEIFGVTLAVFPILAVGVSTISVICLVSRFPDSRLFVVPLHFLLLTALLLSPVGTEPAYINQFSVGGVRYASLLAILPGIHIALELFDRRTERLRAVEKSATAVQAVLFMLCLNVRGSAAYLLFATLTMVGLALWATSTGLDRRLVVKKVGSILSVLILTAVATFALAPRDYQREGRVTANFWHRLFVSLGANPKWPFGDLTTKYRLCAPPYGEPMQAGHNDASGICVWTRYVRANGLPNGDLLRGLYGAAHERLERAAFFQILVDYPAEVLETFAYYKIATALPHFKEAIHVRIAASNPTYRIRQLCLIGLFVIVLWSAYRQTAFRFRHLAAASTFFLMWSILPILFAWGVIPTMVDVLYWFWATLICIGLALVEFATSTWRRIASARQATHDQSTARL